jgi:hypothetical protein
LLIELLRISGFAVKINLGRFVVLAHIFVEWTSNLLGCGIREIIEIGLLRI